MDFKLSNDTKESASAAPAEKGRQNTLLVVLLILVAAFAYLYFFTGLIKPQEEQKTAEAPAPQVVKKPLPPRDGKTAKDDAANGAKKNAAVPAKPGKVTSAEAPSAETPPAKEEPPKNSPPKAEPAKPASAAKKAAPPETKEPKTAAAPKADEKKPSPAAKQQPGVAVKKPAPAQENSKKQAEAVKAPAKVPAGTATVAAKKAPSATVKKEAVASGPWTVVAGNYVLEDAMAMDLARVKGAGLEAAVKQEGRKKTAMNRLLAGDYPSRAEAQTELDKLKQNTSDAFILEQGGKFAVYAGSYLLAARADSEKERLATAGIKLTVQHAEVSIPSKSLTAGTFNDKKAAEAALKKLKRLGFKATLTHP